MFRNPDGFDLAGECDSTDAEKLKAVIDDVEVPLTEAEVDRLARKWLYGPTGGRPDFRDVSAERRSLGWAAYWCGRDVGQETLDAEEEAYAEVVKRAREAAEAILREGIDAVRAYKARTVELERLRKELDDAEYRFRCTVSEAVATRYDALIREAEETQRRSTIAGLRVDGVLPMRMPTVSDWRRREHKTSRGKATAVLTVKCYGGSYRSTLDIRVDGKSWPVLTVTGDRAPSREASVASVRIKARELGVVEAD